MKMPLTIHHRLRFVTSFTLLTAATLVGLPHQSRADPIMPDLSIKVGSIGTINLYIGTNDFTATGNQGIGMPSATGPQSGFTPAGGKTLGQAAKAAGEVAFNWLQIVIAQPKTQDPTFGKVPHADPSNDKNNKTPHDNQPWYLNTGAKGGPPAKPVNPPFDAPALTAKLLEYQDFPTGLGGVGEKIAFDTYLVSLNANDTYDVLAGFTWTLTESKTMQYLVSGLKEISAELPKQFQAIATNYGPTKWTLVPEPPAIMLLSCFLLLTWLSMAVRRRDA